MAKQPCHGREIRERKQHAKPASRSFPKAQHSPSDNAQRPLGANEQLLQIEARIVLHHAVEAIDDRAIGQHRFHPKGIFPGHAVAQHAVAPSVGG